MQTIVRHRDEGEATWFLNGLTTRKASLAETGGAYSLSEHLLTAAGNAPMHVHHDEDEAFYVLEGELDLLVGDASPITIRPGSFGFAPHGVPHRFEVRTPEVRMLVLTSAAGCPLPNQGFEGFQQAAGTPAQAPVLPPVAAPDPVALTAAAAAHGIEILPPPA